MITQGDVWWHAPDPSKQLQLRSQSPQQSYSLLTAFFRNCRQIHFSIPFVKFLSVSSFCATRLLKVLDLFCINGLNCHIKMAFFCLGLTPRWCEMFCTGPMWDCSENVCHFGISVKLCTYPHIWVKQNDCALVNVLNGFSLCFTLLRFLTLITLKMTKCARYCFESYTCSHIKLCNVVKNNKKSNQTHPHRGCTARNSHMLCLNLELTGIYL